MKFLDNTGLSYLWGKIKSFVNNHTTVATCSTVASTSAKVVTINDSSWSLQKGCIIGVKFTNTNTATNVTLNVNNTGAKSIYYNASVYTASSGDVCGTANRTIYYMYDGTYWVWISSGRYANDDNKTAQTVTTTNADYEVLFSGTADNTTRTEQARKNSNLKFNPSTGNLQATQLNGKTIGSDPKFTDTTYSDATTSTHGLMSTSDKSKLDGIASGAEVNQNAFSNVKVGSTTVAADGKTDTLELAGSNVTLTPDATNDKVTIGITKDNVTAALGYTPPTTNTTYSNATTSAAGLMSSSDKSKLDGIAAGAQVNAVTSVAGKTGAVTLAKSDVGLGNVGNFKAVSTVASQGLTDTEKSNARANIGAGTSSFDGAYSSLSGKPTLGTASAKDVPSSGNASTSQVVMGNDTRLSNSRPASDVYSWAKATSKPTYTASEVGAIATTTKGTANGVAELDANGKVPSSQLPSFVDDTIEGYLYNSKWYKESTHTTEIAGETGKIYVELSTNKTYRWSGSAFIEISASLALGETSSTAYRGDRGKIAYDHSQSTHARTDATKTEASSTNGNIKINGTETKVYTHPGSGTNPHGTTKSDVGLGNVGNFKAVSTVASQGLSDTEKANARANIGAGTGNSNLALGTSSSTAYRGDYGNSAYAHASAKGSAFSSGLYKITTNSEGHVTGATAVTKADITRLGIPASDTWRGIQNNLTSDSTTDSLSAAQGKALANGSARDSTKLPAIIGYYGSDTAGTNGWYKVCTVSQSGYSDFAINLLFTQGYTTQATGLLHVHTRCDNGTAINVQTLKWMYRYGFSAGDVKLVTGNNTWSLYVQQTHNQYGRIQVQVISKMGTSGDTTFTLANNTTKESATPGGTAATDGGIVAYANDAGTVNGKTVAVNVPANAKFTDTNTLNTAGSTDTSSKLFIIGATSQGANPQTYSQDTAYIGTDGCLYSNNKKVLTDHQNISGKANLASPTFTGTPKAPTATAGTNTTQIATTAFVQTAVSNAMVWNYGL